MRVDVVSVDVVSGDASGARRAMRVVIASRAMPLDVIRATAMRSVAMRSAATWPSNRPLLKFVSVHLIVNRRASKSQPFLRRFPRESRQRFPPHHRSRSPCRRDSNHRWRCPAWTKPAEHKSIAANRANHTAAKSDDSRRNRRRSPPPSEASNDCRFGDRRFGDYQLGDCQFGNCRFVHR